MGRTFSPHGLGGYAYPGQRPGTIPAQVVGMGGTISGIYIIPLDES